VLRIRLAFVCMYICHSFIMAPHVHPARIRGRFHFGNETADKLDVFEGPVRRSQHLASITKRTKNAAYPEKQLFQLTLGHLTTPSDYTWPIHQATPTNYAY